MPGCACAPRPPHPPSPVPVAPPALDADPSSAAGPAIAGPSAELGSGGRESPQLRGCNGSRGARPCDSADMAVGKQHDAPALHRARSLAGADVGVQPEREPSLARVRYGVYADAAELEVASREASYLALVRSVAITRDQPVFARESALAVHGIPFGLAPDAVFTIGDERTARKKAGVIHAVTVLDPIDVTTVGELLVCTVEHALADVARRREVVVAVAALDWALRNGLASKDGVLEALGRQGKRGRAAAEWAIAFADAAAESVGESYSRVRLHQLGFAIPELQALVVGRSGKEYRVDAKWSFSDRRPLFGEFDGMQKYGELANRAGKSGAAALAQEKAREDDIRFRGDVMRWVWDEMIQPRRFERLLLAHRVPRVRAALPEALLRG
ncbi:MAG: hypothetical protein ACQEWM_00735 [Actinomycetota bacterium]